MKDQLQPWISIPAPVWTPPTAWANLRTGETVCLRGDEVTAEIGRDFIPQDAAALGLYDVLILQGRPVMEALKEVLMAVTGFDKR